MHWESALFGFSFFLRLEISFLSGMIPPLSWSFVLTFSDFFLHRISYIALANRESGTLRRKGSHGEPSCMSEVAWDERTFLATFVSAATCSMRGMARGPWSPKLRMFKQLPSVGRDDYCDRAPFACCNDRSGLPCERRYGLLPMQDGRECRTVRELRGRTYRASISMHIAIGCQLLKIQHASCVTSGQTQI